MFRFHGEIFRGVPIARKKFLTISVTWIYKAELYVLSKKRKKTSMSKDV